MKTTQTQQNNTSMINQQHPITPPPELVEQWASKSFVTQHLCTQIAQWGANQELEACSRWIEDQLCMPPDARADVITKLNDTRRPKPPSLKEQALEALERMEQFSTTEDKCIIRNALDQLND